ncbi:MAG: mevalonate kinase [Thermoplasmatota archaeon]
MISCSAPGKVILFGEHAVVYGKPAIALAVDRRVRCKMSKANEKTTVNGYDINYQHHSYILKCIEKTGVSDPLKITTVSDLPSGAGMGSSAAITVSTLGGLYNLKGFSELESIAKDAFQIEYEVQGGASPIDTSTSLHGSAVMVYEKEMNNLLWTIEKDGKVWNVHHIKIPDIHIVIGDTGIGAPTGPLVEKVRRFYSKSNFAKEVIEDIGNLVLEGRKALEEEDLHKIGKLMNKNHKLLSILGVSHPKLNGLVKAAKRYSYGAKLTGAGGGGSIVALTEHPEKVASAIEERGGTPYILDSSKNGLKVEQTSK